MKVRKLKFRKNMGNDLMYRVNSKRAQGSVTLGVMSLGRFFPKKKKKKKKKYILLNNVYVCGPTPMKLTSHLVFKVRKL